MARYLRLKCLNNIRGGNIVSVRHIMVKGLNRNEGGLAAGQVRDQAIMHAQASSEAMMNGGEGAERHPQMVSQS